MKLAFLFSFILLLSCEQSQNTPAKSNRRTSSDQYTKSSRTEIKKQREENLNGERRDDNDEQKTNDENKDSNEDMTDDTEEERQSIISDFWESIEQDKQKFFTDTDEDNKDHLRPLNFRYLNDSSYIAKDYESSEDFQEEVTGLLQSLFSPSEDEDEDEDVIIDNLKKSFCKDTNKFDVFASITGDIHWVSIPLQNIIDCSLSKEDTINIDSIEYGLYAEDNTITSETFLKSLTHSVTKGYDNDSLGIANIVTVFSQFTQSQENIDEELVFTLTGRESQETRAAVIQYDSLQIIKYKERIQLTIREPLIQTQGTPYPQSGVIEIQAGLWEGELVLDGQAPTLRMTHPTEESVEFTIPPAPPSGDTSVNFQSNFLQRNKK